jgi:hypothetical protein
MSKLVLKLIRKTSSEDTIHSSIMILSILCGLHLYWSLVHSKFGVLTFEIICRGALEISSIWKHFFKVITIQQNGWMKRT